MGRFGNFRVSEALFLANRSPLVGRRSQGVTVGPQDGVRARHLADVERRARWTTWDGVLRIPDAELDNVAIPDDYLPRFPKDFQRRRNGSEAGWPDQVRSVRRGFQPNT